MTNQQFRAAIVAIARMAAEGLVPAGTIALFAGVTEDEIGAARLNLNRPGPRQKLERLVVLAGG